MQTKKIIQCGIFTALIAISAFIRFPFVPVPFTLQTMLVALAGLMMGAKAGAASCLIYLIMGLIGIPVFSSGGGIGTLLSPTAGFLIGFIPCAFVTGLANNNKKSFPRAFLSALSGSIVMYITAITYTYAITNLVTGQGIAISTLLVSYCAVFIPSDIIKAAVAAYIYVRLKKSGI